MDVRHEEKVPLVSNLNALKVASTDKYGAASTVSGDSISLQIPPTSSTEVEVEYDYVVAFPHEAPDIASITKQDVLNRLHLAGLQTEEVFSKSAIFCKIRADIPRLQKEAARVKLPILLDDRKLNEIATTGLRAFHIDPFEVENPPRKWIDFFKRPNYEPYKCIYMPYAKEIDQTMYASHDTSFFSSIHRMQLLESILTNVNGGGAGLDLEKLLSEQVIVACYPLHNVRQKDILQKSWMAWCYAPWQQPLDSIRNYFGPKLALYFAFLGHYTTYVLWASLVGLVVTTLQLAPSDTVSLYLYPTSLSYILPIFGMAMMIWATFFLKHWKRKNAVLAKEWGMSDFDNEKKDIKIFHNRPNTLFQSILRLGGSWLVVGILAGVVCVAVVTVAKNFDQSSRFTWLRVNVNLLSLLMITQIMTMSTVFQWLCDKLNDFENHPTEARYDRSYIAKLVLFELINHFSALSYLAYIGVMDMMTFSWLVYRVYGAYIVLDHVKMFFMRPKERFKSISNYEAQHDMESQYILHQYGSKQSMADHLKLVIHFAYLTLFAVLCPLNPFLSFLHYSLEIRLNGSKLLEFYRRPRPRGAANLGDWYWIMHWILYAAICSNAWLMATLFPNQTLKTIPTTPMPTGNALVSSHDILMSLILLIVVCYIVISVGYQDTPFRVRLQLQRQAYFVAKLYYKAFGWPEHADRSKDLPNDAFEFCLAFPNPEGISNAKDKTAMVTVLDTLKRANIQYRVYPSSVKLSPYLASYIFCEIRATESQLQHEAVRIGLPMLLDESMLKEKAHEGVFQALHHGMMDVVDRLRVEATRVNLMMLIENMMTQPVFTQHSHSNEELAEKIEKLLATLDNREPRHSLSLDHVLGDFKEILEVDIEGAQFRVLDVPQTLLNRIETYLTTGAASPSGTTLNHSKTFAVFDHTSNAVIDQLVDDTVKALHDQPLNTLYLAQKEWKFGLERVLWFMEEFLKQSDVSALELTSPDSNLKWLTMNQYLSSFDSEVLYPKLNSLLVECISLLQIQGTSPYQAFQEFRVKNPTSIVLDLVTALETSIIANPDIEIAPFYLGNPDPKYNLLAKRFKYQPYQHLHMPYYRQLGKWQEVYATPSPYSAFSSMQRMTLIESLLERHLKLDALKAQKVLAGAYPLHDKSDQENLEKEWLSWTFTQPLHSIHDYFGVHVAMYFAHLGHGTKWLAFAALAGVIFSVWQTIYSLGKLELTIVPSYGILMIIWATLWLKHWTRSQSILKLQWGVPLYPPRNRSPVRAAYVGDYIRNPITGQKVIYFKKNARLIRWFLGWVFLSVVVAWSLGGQILIFFVALQHTNIESVPLGTALVVGIWIVTMKKLFNRFIIWLIDFENHRTEASHETAYVVKAGVFHAFNSFAALVYLLQDAQLRNRFSLYAIYGVELVATHGIGLLQLLLSVHTKTSEDQFFLQVFSSTKSMERHFDLVIHFGYMLGGVVVCPLTPLVAFLDHIIAMRLQATQLLKSSRRPSPRKLTGIWYVNLLQYVVVLSIVSNSYLVVFVVKTFGSGSIFSSLDGFCGILLGLVAARHILNSLFNDVPTRVDSQLERQHFVVETITQEQPTAVPVVPAVHAPSHILRLESTSGMSDFSAMSFDDDDIPGHVEEEGFV